MNDNRRTCQVVSLVILLLVTCMLALSPEVAGQTQNAGKVSGTLKTTTGNNSFVLGTGDFLLNGKPFQIISGRSIRHECRQSTGDTG